MSTKNQRLSQIYYSSQITSEDKFLYNTQVKSLSELCELKKVHVVFALYFIIYLPGLIFSTHYISLLRMVYKNGDVKSFKYLSARNVFV